MKVLRRVILIASITIVIGSISTFTGVTNFINEDSVERNLLNGLPGTNNQILVVKIDDTKEAHPQIGLEDADIVYVEQVEAGLTRVAAVYSSRLPELIGPVRSARISDLELLAQFGRVGFAYSGAQSKLRPVIGQANLENLSAERNPPSIYGKDPNRVGPVNMILKPDLLLERANSRSETVIDIPSKSPWKFGKAQESLTPASKIEVSWPNAKYSLVWDEQDEKYLIYFANQPNLAASGEHLFADTAVIQLVKMTPSIYGDKFGGVTPFSETIGSGKAIMLRDGVGHELSWQRSNEREVTTWLRADGKEAHFKPGRIWVFLTDQLPTVTP